MECLPIRPTLAVIKETFYLNLERRVLPGRPIAFNVLAERDDYVNVGANKLIPNDRVSNTRQTLTMIIK